MNKKTKFSLGYVVSIIVVLFMLQTLFFSGFQIEEISYKQFRDAIKEGRIHSVVIGQDRIYGEWKTEATRIAPEPTARQPHILKPQGKSTPWRLRWGDDRTPPRKYFMVYRLDDPDLIKDLQAAGIDYRARLESGWLHNFIVNWIIPFFLLMFIWGLILQKMGPPSPLQVGKNKAKIYAEDPKNRVTFKDVAGIDEAVEEINEVVDFLKNPQKYTRLGAKLPKGVLLVGPPGTGKTLLARATAGEAGVPFFSTTGSEFVEMFVGVGAARVRDLFQQAKERAPCIIFIDEIDAIGKSRAYGGFYGAGYDERENTLNQLLTEMDGFDSSLGVIIMGATNRADVLDPALLRPGRFDRQILVDRPDQNGRRAIFQIYTRRLKLADDVDLDKLAAQTPGFAGAEIANVCNEAALLAGRNGRELVSMADFEAAIERVVAGLEKKNKLINETEKRIVAYHECGHAVVGHFTPAADPVHKISIVPRGFGALGYTLQTPLQDRYLLSRDELLARIKGLLGGRAAEEVFFHQISTGASNDLEQAWRIGRNMVAVYGMGRRLPHLSLAETAAGDQLTPLGRRWRLHSEKVEEVVDEEVAEIVRQCYEEARDLIREKRELVDRLARALLEKEVLYESDITAILGPRPVPGQAQKNERGQKKDEEKTSHRSGVASV